MKIRLKLCLGVLALIAGVLAMGRTADAAVYPACSGENVWDVPGNQGVELYDVTGYDVRNYDLPFSLPAGTYDMVASSFDGYIGRKDVPVDKQERSERWYAEFLDATGNVVGAMDRPTTDLPDDTDVAELLDHYEDIKLTGTAVSVRLILAKDFESLNLVYAGCIGFTRQADPTTTTTPRTTGGAAGPSNGVYVPLTPTRAFDTRLVGLKAAGGTGYTTSLTGVPANATAVELNVTVNAPEADGYITLAPAGSGLPLVSNLNFVAGETTANHAIVALSGGQLSFLSSVNAHVVLDVAGYWTPAAGPTTGGRFVALPPMRAVDTRATPEKVGPGGHAVNLAAAGVPADARAVAVNITATQGDAEGYVTAWSGSGTAPYVSNLNYAAGQTIANSAIVPVLNVSGSPQIRVLALGPTHIIVDVSGYFTGDSAASSTSGQFVAATPSRVLDTRDGTGRLAPPDSVNCTDFDTWTQANEWFWTYSSFGDPFVLDTNADNIPCETLPGKPATAIPQPLANARVPRNGIIPTADNRAAGATALVLNLTVAAPARAGYITAFPAGAAQPYVSNVNPAYPGHIRPGLAIVGTGTAGQVHLYTSGASHLVADAAGWFI